MQVFILHRDRDQRWCLLGTASILSLLVLVSLLVSVSVKTSSSLLFTTRQRSCGKVVFSQVSVCPGGVGISGPMSFRWGWGGISGTRSLLGGEGYVQWGGNTLPHTWDLGGGMSRGWVPTSMGHQVGVCPWGPWTFDTTGYGTHPTGMLSC